MVTTRRDSEKLDPKIKILRTQGLKFLCEGMEIQFNPKDLSIRSQLLSSSFLWTIDGWKEEPVPAKSVFTNTEAPKLRASHISGWIFEYDIDEIMEYDQKRRADDALWTEVKKEQADDK